MEPTTQIIRLSIPGSIFVLAGVGTYAFAQVVWDQKLSEVESLTTLTTSITAIAASIPLGFLLYQLYYWLSFPFMVGGLVTRDQGREALSGLPEGIVPRLRTLFDARLDVRRHHSTTPILRRIMLFRLNEELLRAHYKDPTLGEEGEFFERDERNLRRIYKNNWHENWDAFRALLDLVATRGGRPEIQKSFSSLYDIYHSLGASRLAVVLGALGGVLYLCGAHQQEIQEQAVQSALGLLGVVLMAGLLAYVIHRTRLATWNSAISKVRFDLIAYFHTEPEFVENLPDAHGFTPRRSLRSERPRPRSYERPPLAGAVRPSVRRLLGDIGTIEWTEETNGILGPRERARFRVATAISIGAELRRISAARRGRRAAGPDPSDVALPDTPLTRHVERACQALGPMVREHGYRSYIFGRTLAMVEGVDCDNEALFAACMLHDYGFASMERLDGECFTLAGVAAAKRVLRGSSLSPQAQRDVLDAITLHLNPVVDVEQGAVQRYTHGGVLLDVLGQRASDLDPEGIERVIAAHPRYGLTSSGGLVLEEHARAVRRSRTRVLLKSGFGAALKRSRWQAVDRSVG